MYRHKQTFNRGPVKPLKSKFVLNDDIPHDQLLVIGPDGKKIGIISKAEALEIAKKDEMDLVLFSAGDVPTAKIINYSKFLFEFKKKNKDNKKQTVAKNKEIKVKPLIGAHDLEVRIKNAREWILSGCRVRFAILAYGRVGSKKELIEAVYQKFEDAIKDIGVVQQPLRKATPVMYEAYFTALKK